MMMMNVMPYLFSSWYKHRDEIYDVLDDSELDWIFMCWWLCR